MGRAIGACLGNAPLDDAAQGGGGGARGCWLSGTGSFGCAVAGLRGVVASSDFSCHEMRRVDWRSARSVLCVLYGGEREEQDGEEDMLNDVLCTMSWCVPF
eukprot:6191587-Prymnesium_polylepis.1